jgi:uroporphyrinogen-III synthase
MAEARPRRLVALTRPRPESERLARDLEAGGYPCLIAPLLEIVPEPGPAPDLRGVQAIVLTSANAVPALQRLPAYTVGDATAAAARSVHGGPIISAGSDACGLARLIRRSLDPAAGALLHLAGAEVRPEPRASLEAAGFAVRSPIVYRAIPAADLPKDLEAALRAGTLGAILLFSPRTARTFHGLVAKAGLEATLGTVDALCLSAAVGRGLEGLTFRRLKIAAAPERAAVLALLDGVP